jgi:hypothetical protein
MRAQRAFILDIPFPLKHNNPEASAPSHRLQPRVKYVVKLMLLWDMHVPNCNFDRKSSLLVVHPSRLFYERDLALPADDIEIEADFVEGLCLHDRGALQEGGEDGAEEHHFYAMVSCGTFSFIRGQATTSNVSLHDRKA